MCEVDEQWSFVGKKKNQRWLWYAWNLDISESLLMYLGNGTQKHSINSNVFFCRLLFLFIAQMILKVYSSYLPRENHIIGKRYTQRIERTNLTLRFSTKKISKKNHWFFEKRRDAR
ncbi:IS1 family transposase [Photobacterium damselae subsp. piscicida]|nr:IS1 family transposase [Photobacterium damselae subsp. piscicida]